MQSSLTILKNTPLFYIAFGLIAQLDCLCNCSGYIFMAKSSLNGLSKHPLYAIYFKIIERCENPKRREYKYYGAIGVTMCPQWRNDFKLFYDWAMANGWRKDLVIDKDKIPRELGVPALIYSPEMCSIITRKENMNAMSTNRMIEYKGVTKTLSQWADEYGINYKMLWSRLKLGFDFELALTRPNRTIQQTSALNRKIILNTETGIFYLGAKEAAESANIPINNLQCKLTGKLKNNTPFIYA